MEKYVVVEHSHKQQRLFSFVVFVSAFLFFFLCVRDRVGGGVGGGCWLFGLIFSSKHQQSTATVPSLYLMGWVMLQE
jgi:hypothetical protein